MYFSTIFRGSILIFLLLIFRPRLTAALPTGLAWALVKVSFSSELAIVVGADKYLLFPAWQGNEWEGRGTHCDRGVRDTNKPAGSFLPHWHLKTPIRYWLCTGTDPRMARAGSVWVRDGGEETESEGTRRGGGQRQSRRRPQKKTQAWGGKRALLKRRVEKVPLWELFTWRTTSGTHKTMEQRGSTTPDNADQKKRGADVMNTHVSPGFISLLTHFSTKET